MSKFAFITLASLAIVLLFQRVSGQEGVSYNFSITQATNDEAECSVAGTKFSGLAHYVVGEPNLPGSVYADCLDGTTVCYEDDGIADTMDKTVACSSLDLEERHRKLSLTVREGHAWPRRVVCYKFGSQFSAQSMNNWKTAFKRYQQRVGITFVKSDQCRSRYGRDTQVCNNCNTALTIQNNEAGCWAHLGFFKGNWQPKLNVGRGCDFLGTYMHEMGHVIGLQHEHQHPKRDVIILRGNLPVGSSNYVTLNAAGRTPYDRRSVMHYNGREMCIPKDPKIKFCGIKQTAANGCVVPKEEHCDRSKQYGGQGVITDRDVKGIHKLYAKEQKHPKSPVL